MALEATITAGPLIPVGKSWNIKTGEVFKNEVNMETDFKIDIDLKKIDEEQMLVFGWLSVAKDELGNDIIDKQGDIVPVEELEKAAYDFNLFARKAGDMHKNTNGVGRLVESVVFTEEKQKALGIPQGILKIGWFVGFKIDDVDVWKRIKSGELSAFSIGGKAQREEVKIDDETRYET